MKINENSIRKKTNKSKTRFTRKFNEELRSNWPDICSKDWDRLETDKDFKEGFLLALDVVLTKINAAKKEIDTELVLLKS